jgi:hypothetical protein
MLLSGLLLDAMADSSLTLRHLQAEDYKKGTDSQLHMMSCETNNRVFRLISRIKGLLM